MLSVQSLQNEHPNGPNIDRPASAAGLEPIADVEITQQVRIGKFKIPTEALRAYTMMFALVAIWLFFQWATVDARNPYGLFLSGVNFSKLMQQTAVTGVLAVGMLMVIVSGNIDLSIGSLVGLAGAIAALSQGRGLLFTLVSAIVIGVGVGAFQGTLVAYLNVPAFIVTLGGLLAWPGVSFGRTQGRRFRSRSLSDRR
jgi:D-xylose transport system permease protein